MGLFDTIVGGSSSPVFLSYQRRNRLDVSPLLKYADYRSKVAQQALGARPGIMPTEIKEGIAYTDVRLIEQMQQQGMKEIEDVFKSSGYDYAYAVTTPEYKKAMGKINVPVSDILRLKQEKEELDSFNKSIADKQAGDLVFTSDQGMLGAFGAYDPKKKSWITNAEASNLRQTDPTWAYQVNPNIKMTSVLKRGKDVNENLDLLFNQAQVSKVGGTYQSVGAKPWGDTVAVMLNTIHGTTESNRTALNDAINFFSGYLSEEDKVGMFNEFIKSPDYQSKYLSKEKAGTLDTKEVAQDFMSNYMPEYIKQRAGVFFKTATDQTIASDILEKDLKKAEEDKVKISTWDSYFSGSQFAYPEKESVFNVSFGSKLDEDKKSYEDVRTINMPLGRMHETDIETLNKDVRTVSGNDVVFNKPANAFGPTAIGPSGMMMDLDDLVSKGGWKIDNVPGDIRFGISPEKDVIGKYMGIDEKYFIDSGKKGPDGKTIFVPDFTKAKPQPFVKVTVSTDEDDVDDKMSIILQDETGKYRKEDAIADFWNINDVKDEFEDKGLLREKNGRMEMDLWVPLSNIMQYDPGLKKETNIKVEQLLQEQQKRMSDMNKAYTPVK